MNDHTYDSLPHQSVSVAPLRIEKACTRRASPVPSKSSRGTRSSGGRSSQSSDHQHYTPPPSPPIEQQEIEFHPFLRAFYPFHPQYSPSSRTVTLPLNSGDVILVHSIHTNGWADGTMLSSGARGWLPTNYCESYEAIHIRPLLKGCLNLFEQFRAGSANSNAVTGMVAGVRYLLESTECLTREADLVQSNSTVRKSRKDVLTELSGLVKTAKKIEGDATAELAAAIVDEIILRSFKIVVRGVRFLDVWYDQYEITSSDYIDCYADIDDTVPPTPPCDRLTPASQHTTNFEPEKSAEGYFGSRPEAPEQQRQLTQFKPYRGGPASGRRDSHPMPSTPYAQTPRVMAVSPFARRQSVETAPAQPVYALARLNTTHDVLLSYLGSYIGRIHLQARFTAQLELTQQQSVAAARDLLAVVEAIYSRDPRAKALEVVKEAMYQRISALITAAREVVADFKEEDMYEDEDGIMMQDGGRSLVEAATGCVRGAGECVAKSKFAIEKIGDFILEPAAMSIGLGITTDVPSPAEVVSEVVSEEVNGVIAGDSETAGVQDIPPTTLDVDRELMPPPPAPDKIPPPLPLKESNYSEPPTPPPKDEITPTVASFPPLTVDTSMGRPSTAGSSGQPSRPGSFVRPSTSSSFRQSMSGSNFRRSTTGSIAMPSTFRSSPVRYSQPPKIASSPRRASNASSIVPPLLSISTSLPHSDYAADSIASPPTKAMRNDSISTESFAATDSIAGNSIRGSEFSVLSRTSTRATTPEPFTGVTPDTPLLNTDLSRLGGSQLSLSSIESGSECTLESHAEDLTFNKDGQITGGTLPALVERLTVGDSTPDAVFVATFYLTFRLFTSARGFAEALVERFDAVSESSGGTPVRLRVYNVFKQWLESHWRNTTDADALEVITDFADTRLEDVIPAAAKRLKDLCEKVSAVTGPLVPRLVSKIDKMTSGSTTFSAPETPIPSPAISRSQMNALKAAVTHAPLFPVGILDFDPLELARQFTLKESRMFCSICPEELLAQEWGKKGSIAKNVLAMSSLSTDLAHLVAETILDVPDIKKRAIVIKHWIKIADRCLELNNYDSLMAIMCTLNASTVVRLKKTWELVSVKHKEVLENLRAVIDVSKNYAVLRARLRGHVPPCLPFLGTYLTDLTFVDVGNPSIRPISGNGKELINFDKHIKTARIISELQRFQIPYRIAEVPELQTWIDMQIDRIHNSKAADVQHLYRRSLLLEPRETQVLKPNPELQTPPVPGDAPTPPAPAAPQKEPSSAKTDLFAWAHVFKTPAN